MVDLPAALAQPPRLSLVSYLIQAAVLSCHKNTAQVRGCDGDHVGVVCWDGEKRIWQQLHPTGHAVVQTCNPMDRRKDDYRIAVLLSTHFKDKTLVNSSEPRAELTSLAFGEAQAQNHNIHRGC